MPPAIALLACLLLSANVAAANLPAWFPLPAEFRATHVAPEAWGEMAVRQVGDRPTQIVRGRHWYFDMEAGGFGEEEPGRKVFAKLKASLLKGNWRVAHEFDENPYSVALQYVGAGRTAWAFLTVFGAPDIRGDIVEVMPQPLAFSLPAPATTPETLQTLKGDIPFLPPLPGSRPITGGWNDVSMKYVPEGSEELVLLGSGYVGKSYAGPESGLSNIQFFTVYRDALLRAGWTIVQTRQDIGSADTFLLAHYTKDGRDIWAHLHAGGGEYAFEVADAGGTDFARQLAKDCRAPLYGVLFDFNQATLRPESESVLGRALSAIRAAETRAFEIQGHTDNVGGDAYNQKLSESRARTVMQWFVSRGIEPSRLTARGYGRQQPVADNDSDEGRAKNRRVELACRKSASR